MVFQYFLTLLTDKRALAVKGYLATISSSADHQLKEERKLALMSDQELDVVVTLYEARAVHAENTQN